MREKEEMLGMKVLLSEVHIFPTPGMHREAPPPLPLGYS